MLCLLTDNNKPNHNTIVCCVYWPTTTNPTIIGPHIMFTDGRQKLSVDIIYCCIMVGLSSSVSKHNMWWYYDWVCRFCRPSVNIICGPIMVGFVVGQKTQHVVAIRLDLSLLSSVSKHNIWSYHGWFCRIIIQAHILLTDRRQQR
jgi:hypothetical protein